MINDGFTFSFWWRGDAQENARAAALPIVCLGVATVLAGNRSHDRESESAADELVADTRGVGAPEPFEGMGKENRGETRAAVADRYLDLRSVALCRELDARAIRCVTERVVDEIVDGSA